MLEHPNAREIFPRYLTVGYHVAHATVNLIEAALDRSRLLAPADEVASGLAVYLERHLVEERHGEEPGGGVLDDLAALGVDTTALVDEPASRKIASLVGAQYYWIFHQHPVAVLGFLQLETYHPHAPTIERLIERTGLPRDGFRQLLEHAVVDVAHAQELRDVLDALPLTPRHEQLIGLSAVHTFGGVTELLLDVVRAPARAPAAS